jgi:hypothetical protein
MIKGGQLHGEGRRALRPMGQCGAGTPWNSMSRYVSQWTEIQQAREGAFGWTSWLFPFVRSLCNRFEIVVPTLLLAEPQSEVACRMTVRGHETRAHEKAHAQGGVCRCGPFAICHGCFRRYGGWARSPRRWARLPITARRGQARPGTDSRSTSRCSQGTCGYSTAAEGELAPGWTPSSASSWRA